MGECKLCGVHGYLTYEHVPPKSANNKHNFYTYSLDVTVDDPFLEKSKKGRPSQGGIGYYSLCELCNNKTGGWYGNAYTNFVNQAIYRLRLSNYQYINGDPFIIHPLKIIKQVVSFFISIGSINYSEHYPELTEFVLNKHSRMLPDNYQLYIYYNDSSNYRYMADNFVSDNGIIQNYSEVAHFPFGFLLSFQRTAKLIDERLVEITSWKNYPFDKKDRWIAIPLKKLPIEIASFPGDYRARQEIEEVIKNSKDRYKNS